MCTPKINWIPPKKFRCKTHNTLSKLTSSLICSRERAHALNQCNLQTLILIGLHCSQVLSAHYRFQPTEIWIPICFKALTFNPKTKPIMLHYLGAYHTYVPSCQGSCVDKCQTFWPISGNNPQIFQPYSSPLMDPIIHPLHMLSFCLLVIFSGKQLGFFHQTYWLFFSCSLLRLVVLYFCSRSFSFCQLSQQQH